MAAETKPELDFDIQPVIPDRWKDFESLFGERGACGGCWCMWLRLKRAEFESQKGEGNRKAMKKVIQSGEIPGLLAYIENKPVAWCAVAPRETYSALERSRILKPVDDLPVWSIVCLFVAKPFRKKGVTIQLLKAAVEYAGSRGANIVEGYPSEPKKGKTADVFAYMGLVSAYQKAGFVEVARPSETRSIVRYVIK